MKTILYFIANPSDAQIAFAKTHKMAIRNPQAYSPSDYIEPCAAVYGEAPEAYLARFPLFEPPAEAKADEAKAGEEKALKAKRVKEAKDAPKHTE